MTVGVVVFPGTNCEHDVVAAVRSLASDAEIVWHGDRRLPTSVDAVVIPGGFAHGDYLRCGAIARFSPVMEAVSDFARSGGPVLGICNGFQVLTEAGLLPGALQKNRGLKFLCQPAVLEVTTVRSSATAALSIGQRITLPINHFEGCYTADRATLDRLRDDDRVVMRYVENPNGSLDDIAGVCNEGRNVVGMMPHPERASAALLGSVDGVGIFESLLVSAPRG